MTLNKRDQEGLTESHTQNFQYVDQAESETGFSGADPVLVIKGGPNSERLLSNLRKQLKRGKFFLTTPSLIVKRN